jgi:hypothetical protein
MIITAGTENPKGKLAFRIKNRSLGRMKRSTLSGHRVKTVKRHNEGVVKTSLAPGSYVVISYLEEAGLDEALQALDFYTVGYGVIPPLIMVRLYPDFTDTPIKAYGAINGACSFKPPHDNSN